MTAREKMNIDLVKQYAENQNQRQSIVIVFIGSIALAIASFGYTLDQFVKHPLEKHSFLLTLSAVFSMFILLLINVLSLFFSYSLRRDQFVIDKIRKDLCGEKYAEYYSTYNPKKSVQDFYLILIFGSIIFKTGLLSAFLCATSIFSNCDCNMVIPIIAYFICIIITIVVWVYYRQKLQGN